MLNDSLYLKCYPNFSFIDRSFRCFFFMRFQFIYRLGVCCAKKHISGRCDLNRCKYRFVMYVYMPINKLNGSNNFVNVNINTWNKQNVSFMCFFMHTTHAYTKHLLERYEIQFLSRKKNCRVFAHRAWKTFKFVHIFRFVNVSLVERWDKNTMLAFL